jgi:hypothetical protein
VREPGNTPIRPGEEALGWASPLRRPALSPHFRLRLRRRVRHGPPARRVLNKPRNHAAGLVDLVAVIGPPRRVASLHHENKGGQVAGA